MASLLHTDGSVVFARLHQRAPQPNTCFLWPIQVQIPNGIPIRSAVFAQLTAQCRYTLELQWAALSLSKLPLPVVDLDPI